MCKLFALLFILYSRSPYAAIIPGPGEPHTDQMNFILKPLVNELKELYRGIYIDGKRFRVKAMIWSCDLPALRKSLGFLSCNANKGCSKCHQVLRENGVDTIQLGTPRTNEEHRLTGERLEEMATTAPKSAKEDLEKQTGIRWAFHFTNH